MSAPQASRLGIGIIGAGRVGPVLGRALAGAGHAITGVSAVSEESRERAETMLPGVPVLEVQEIVRRSELVLLAIPGNEIPGLVSGLAKLGAWQPGQLVIHTAPEHGTAVFAEAPGVIPIALHPSMVFTGTSLDLARLTGATVAVTAPSVVQPIGQALVVEMGAEPVIVAEHDRAAYAEAVTVAAAAARLATADAILTLQELGIARAAKIVGGAVQAAIDEETGRYAGDPELGA
ncbi:NAD(P)-binding domain-containing protein [Leucobacter sp. BZR 635]